MNGGFIGGRQLWLPRFVLKKIATPDFCNGCVFPINQVLLDKKYWNFLDRFVEGVGPIHHIRRGIVIEYLEVHRKLGYRLYLKNVSWFRYFNENVNDYMTK